MSWWLIDRGQISTGKALGSGCLAADPPSWESNAGITKIKAQQGKGEPPARLWLLDTVDGHAQSGQFGCHHSRLWHGSARPSGCQAFLRLAAPKNAATGAAAAAAWSPPRYLISNRMGEADMRLAKADAWYLISPGRSCIAPASP